MGIIHSRAAKKRDRAQAALLREQERELRGARKAAEHDERAEAAGDSLLRQPTVGDALAAWKRRRDGA